MASYLSSMTDSEWKILETLIPPKPDTLRGRPQEHSKRSIVDGILYIIQTRGAWRTTPEINVVKTEDRCGGSGDR